MMFEVFDLAEALLGLFFRLVRSAKIFPRFLRQHFISALHFFYHARSPSLDILGYPQFGTHESCNFLGLVLDLEPSFSGRNAS